MSAHYDYGSNNHAKTVITENENESGSDTDDDYTDEQFPSKSEYLSIQNDLIEKNLTHQDISEGTDLDLKDSKNKSEYLQNLTKKIAKLR